MWQEPMNATKKPWSEVLRQTEDPMEGVVMEFKRRVSRDNGHHHT